MVRVERTLRADPQDAWRILTDLQEWPRWGPTVSRAELDDSQGLALGAHGRVWAPVGPALPFVVTEFVAGRRWRWTVAGVAATAHEVRPLRHGCRVVFYAPWWAAAYLPVCAVALRRIQHLLDDR
jgi:uncharacterized protein YndB with AHSA1/START domain